MTDEVVTPRVYRVFLLNADLQKQGDSIMVVENIRIGASGVLECDRIWTDSPIKTKVFYNGEFYITELDEEQIEEFKTPDNL